MRRRIGARWPAQFTGTLVHDDWRHYRTLPKCVHGLCNAHHVRELTCVHEEIGQDRADDAIAALLCANRLAHRLRAQGPRSRILRR